MGPGRISRLMVRVRASCVEREDYRKLLQRAHFSIPDPVGISLYDVEGWRRHATKFALFYGRFFPDCLPILRDLEHRMIATPEELARLDNGAAARLAETTNEPNLVMELRNADCANSSQSQPHGDRLRLDTHASLLAQSIRKASTDIHGWPLMPAHLRMPFPYQGVLLP